MITPQLLNSIMIFLNLIQISDFGLAKWLPDQWTHHIVSNFEGTFGLVNPKTQNGFSILWKLAFQVVWHPPQNHDSYLPPEYFMHGVVDEKTDVYAHGVLLLELITGRKALDSSQQSLVMWVCYSFFLHQLIPCIIQSILWNIVYNSYCFEQYVAG